VRIAHAAEAGASPRAYLGTTMKSIREVLRRLASWRKETAAPVPQEDPAVTLSDERVLRHPTL
jgi:hypothetical protein